MILSPTHGARSAVWKPRYSAATRGMPTVKAPDTSLSVGEAALRAVASALIEANRSTSTRVGMLTTDGRIEPGTALDPDPGHQERLQGSRR